MLAIFIRTDAATDEQIISSEFLTPLFSNFGQKPILIIHHHSTPDLESSSLQLRAPYTRDVGIVHCRDDGQTLPNGNSIFIQNFCRAFNSYEDFSGTILILNFDR